MSENCSSVPSFADAFDFCAPEYGFGEIERVVVADIGDDKPTNFETATVIPVRGTLDAPDQSEIETSLYRKAYPPARYELTCTVDDLSDTAYAALQAFHGGECLLWFQAGDYLFGGEGLRCSVKTHLTIEEGEDSLHKGGLHFSWRANTMPDREESPWSDES